MTGLSPTPACPGCGFDRLTAADHFCPQCQRPLAGLQRFDPWRDKIIAYRKLLERATHGFMGRAWLDQLVADFLTKKDGPRHLLLVGEPGCGKTSYLAHLARTYRYPHHFIGRGTLLDLPEAPDWRSPVRLAESVGYQLIRDFGGWIMDWDDWGVHVSQTIRELKGVAIGVVGGSHTVGASSLTVEQEIDRFGQGAMAIGVYIREMHLDPELVIRQLVTRPLQAIADRYPDHQVVILIDGLDEAGDYSNPRHNILGLLPLAQLPPSVRFVFASRPGDHLDQPFKQACQTVWLSADPQGTLREEIESDALSFADALSKEEEIAARLVAHGKQPAWFAAAAAAASQGNFLYLYHLAENLRSESVDEALLKLETLPTGLGGIYSYLLAQTRRRLNDIAFWTQVVKPVLGVLSVARAPLDRNQIAAFAAVDPDSTAAVLAYLQPFLETNRAERIPRYAIYHLSFGEYMLSPDNEDGIDAARAHARIVRHYRRGTESPGTAGWDVLDVYGQDHLPLHAVWSSSLPPLLEEPGFLTHCAPGAIREGIELAQGLTPQHERVAEVLFLAYPHLLQVPPAQRAAVLHLFALKRGANSVAGLFAPLLKSAPFQTVWTATGLADIPYRQRATAARVDTLAVAELAGVFSVIFSENVGSGDQQLTVWQPAADTVRTTVLQGRPSFERSAAIQAGEQAYLVLYEMSLGGDSVLILDLEKLEIVQSSWNQSVAVFAKGDEVIVAEADFEGGLYMRPLNSPPMYRSEGNLETGFRLFRNEATEDESPTTVLSTGIRAIVPLRGDLLAPRLLLADHENGLHIHGPFGDGSTIPLGVDLGPGGLIIRTALIRGEPVAAILSYHHVHMLDPRDGRSLGHLEYSLVHSHSDAMHWNDIALLESPAGAFLILQTSEEEVLFMDIVTGEIVRTAVLDKLHKIAVGFSDQGGFLVTGHESAVKVWTPEKLVSGERADAGYTPLLVAAMVDGTPLGVALTGYHREKERQVRVFGLLDGTLLYEHTVSRWTFRPHFLALCQANTGPFVVFQPDWWRDEVEVHPLGPGGLSTTWYTPDGRPGWMDDPLFRLLDFQLTQINPSRACEWFISETLRDRIETDDFWTAHVSRCALDRQGKVLAGDLYNKHHQSAIKILAAGEHPLAVSLENIHPRGADLLAITRYEARIVAVTFDSRSGDLAVWDVAGVGRGNDKSILLQLMTDGHTPLVSFGRVGEQLIVALGLKSDVAVFPLTPGPLSEPLRVPGQVTSLVCGPDGFLLLAMPDGVLTVRLRPPEG